MMKKRAKSAWVKALRSGEYKQTSGMLCDAKTGEMCCLGVLIDVTQDGDWRLEHGRYEYECSAGAPDDNVRHDVGLNASNVVSLVNLNDALGYSFAQIADWIEENL